MVARWLHKAKLELGSLMENVCIYTAIDPLYRSAPFEFMTSITHLSKPINFALVGCADPTPMNNRNTGFHVALHGKYTWLACIDANVIVYPSWLSRLESIHSKYSADGQQVACIGSLMVTTHFPHLPQVWTFADDFKEIDVCADLVGNCEVDDVRKVDALALGATLWHLPTIASLIPLPLWGMRMDNIWYGNEFLRGFALMKKAGLATYLDPVRPVTQLSMAPTVSRAWADGKAFIARSIDLDKGP
jgi:hypothetical protein